MDKFNELYESLIETITWKKIDINFKKIDNISSKIFDKLYTNATTEEDLKKLYKHAYWEHYDYNQPGTLDLRLAKEWKKKVDSLYDRLYDLQKEK